MHRPAQAQLPPPNKGTNNPLRSHAVGSVRICPERLPLELDDDCFGITGSRFMRMRYGSTQ
jgi:hypothetical protein